MESIKKLISVSVMQMKSIKKFISELFNKEYKYDFIKEKKQEQEINKQSKEQSDKDFILGVIYHIGLGVEKDYTEAIKWYKLSAEQGNAFAQNSLGLMYDNGQGVKKDYKEAIKWFKLSAEQGYNSAQNNLGLMYEEGLGVEKDIQEAIKWYKLSADQGNECAKNNLDDLYKDKETIIALIMSNYMKIKEQEEEIKKVKEENEKLTYMAPLEGGPEYQKLKKSFEDKVKNNFGSLDTTDTTEITDTTDK